MTLFLAITGPESIWLLADRRLSAPGCEPKDDACKIMSLETSDGVALLGYSGLGATPHGSQPSDWMSAVLRGRNYPMELSIEVIAQALNRQLPKHLAAIGRNSTAAHHVVIPAFVQDEPRLYSIELVVEPNCKVPQCKVRRYTPRKYQFAIGGSGAEAPFLNGKKWMRLLTRLMKVHGRRKISHKPVSDALAKINEEVAELHDSVGQRSIVAWRYRKAGIHKGGGGHSFYSGTNEDDTSPAIPTITTGIDVVSLIQLIMPQVEKLSNKLVAGEPSPEINRDEMNELLTRLPVRPDETLR